MLKIIREGSPVNEIDIEMLRKRIRPVDNLIVYFTTGDIKVLRRIHNNLNAKDLYGFVSLKNLNVAPTYMDKTMILSLKRAMNDGVQPFFFASLLELYKRQYGTIEIVRHKP